MSNLKLMKILKIIEKLINILQSILDVLKYMDVSEQTNYDQLFIIDINYIILEINFRNMTYSCLGPSVSTSYFLSHAF